MFQFHFGTIKTGISFDIDKFLLSFQFHFGTIKTGFVGQDKNRVLVSIPLWYD